MPVIETPGGGCAEYLDFDFHTGEERRGAPVLLIHGLGCTWRVWVKQIRALVARRRVIVVNCRGSGQSRPPQSQSKCWTTADMARDVAAVTTALDLPVHAVVGLSMGGTVALQYALDYPERVGRLAVVASFAGIPDFAKPLAETQLENMKEDPVRVTAQHRMDVAFTEAADPALKAWAVDMIAAMDHDYYVAQAAATFAFNVTERLGELKMPVTVVAGELDRTVPIVLAQGIAAGIPGSTFVQLDGFGHFATLEAAELFEPHLMTAIGEVVACRVSATDPDKSA